MKTYAVHGLVLGAEFAFPELVPVTGQDVDVEVSLGPTGAEPPDGVVSETWIAPATLDTSICWRDFGAVRVKDGRTIRVDPNSDLDADWLRAVIVGQLMTLVLQQLGHVPLHSSSVVIDGGGVAFAGLSGEGKSTLGAALVQRGHTFLSDDVTALTLNGESPCVHPGIPRQRLAHEVLTALGLPEEEFEKDPRDPEKAVRLMHEACHCGQVPLRAIVLLASGVERSRIEAISPRRAFTAIMENVHRPELHAAALSGEQFMRRCAAVAKAVPVVRLERPRGLEHVPEAIHCLEKHLS